MLFQVGVSKDFVARRVWWAFDHRKRYVATIGVCWHHHVVSCCEVGYFGGAGRQVTAPRSNQA